MTKRKNIGEDTKDKQKYTENEKITRNHKKTNMEHTKYSKKQCQIIIFKKKHKENKEKIKET